MPDQITVHLLRHAHSSREVAGERDHARELDERGRRETASLRAQLLRLRPQVRHVVCSTARRARATVEPLADLFPDAVPRNSDDLYALGVEAYETAALDAGSDGPILLVGHNPTIERFLHRFCPGDREAVLRGVGTANWITVRLPIGPDGGFEAGVVRDWLRP